MDKKIHCCYVEKKPGFDAAAKSAESELSEVLRLPGIQIRLFNCYKLTGLPEKDWESIAAAVLSEPMCDEYFDGHLPPVSQDSHILYVEPLPGQFDARADSCGQCVQMLLGGPRPCVKTMKVYAIRGIDADAFRRVKAYLINPLESREALPDTPEAPASSFNRGDIPVIAGFTDMDENGLETLRLDCALAMTMPDILTVRSYFKKERRDPTQTELRVIDTYWSDHCRHSTFNTVIKSAVIKDRRVKQAYELFLSVNGERDVTLMNIATAAMRYLRSSGRLPMLDESEENNACTILLKQELTNEAEDWLLFFKNETHNHPTEIEPFGGASTCIGGAIRDPLSGRAFVYQSMRITGAGDPCSPIEDTLPGKLPQRKLTVTAAEGFSSYGNQIGLATGFVREIYHNGYIAKRLETGAVIGAAPASFVRRETPAAGDAVVILGGRTGRDGIGGATGSSKTHGTGTVSDCASEVQKGNAPEEHKLQRLFRNPGVTALIKKCNDFGAGGIAVAVGELSGGIEINLDVMPVKYEGLTGTELAISESQERMAVVINRKDLPALLNYAREENIEATEAAVITGGSRLVMTWNKQRTVDIDRAFLDTNGAKRFADVYVPDFSPADAGRASEGRNLREALFALAGDLNFCSQKGLVERFDSSVGSSSVLMPFGGKYAASETQVMAAVLPCLKAGFHTASVMAYGYDPYFTESDPFAGSAYAVVTSAAKLIAAGVACDMIHLSFQEYFKSLRDDPKRWGQPFAALLGAFSAQMGLGIAAIGGKDSMSGSFGDLDVPPTLISFAAGIADARQLISPEFKGADHPVYLLETPSSPDGLPDYGAVRDLWDSYTRLVRGGKVLSAWTCETGGVYGGIMKMAFGGMIGFKGDADSSLEGLKWGSIIFETDNAGADFKDFRLLGYTQGLPELKLGETTLDLAELHSAWEDPLEKIFPVRAVQQGDAPVITYSGAHIPRRGESFAKPKAVIPVFPGTNGEYDMAAAIKRAGGVCETVLVRNLTPEILAKSVSELEKAIKSAQMILFPGGFSGGDEPDGSGKFIVSLFRNQGLTDAVHELTKNRDGLVLGICNGFQALVKLGLLPYGEVSPMTAACPTLTFNRIGRHQARYVNTRVSSVSSPWLSRCKPGEIYSQTVSHGEGRFAASEKTLEALRANGQIAFQYADYGGLPSMDIAHNPNGSAWAVEGITSPDGRVLGKMGHTERWGEYTAVNIPGNKYLPLFEGGVDYFK